MIDGTNNSANKEEPNPICQAYDFFFDTLGKSADEEDDEPIDLVRLERLLLDEVEVVSITLEDDDNEYRIFESLNWKGAPLSQADLLRNYFFHAYSTRAATKTLRQRMASDAGDA